MLRFAGREISTLLGMVEDFHYCSSRYLKSTMADRSLFRISFLVVIRIQLSSMDSGVQLSNISSIASILRGSQ